MAENTQGGSKPDDGFLVEQLAIERLKEIAARWEWAPGVAIWRLFNAMAHSQPPIDIAALLWSMDFVRAIETDNEPPEMPAADDPLKVAQSIVALDQADMMNATLEVMIQAKAPLRDREIITRTWNKMNGNN